MIISGLKSMILLSKIWKPPDIREAPVAMTPWYRGFKGNVREPKHWWEDFYAKIKDPHRLMVMVHIYLSMVNDLSIRYILSILYSPKDV